jgi:hypothetical protein
MACPAITITTWLSQRSSYEELHGEFAQTKATTAAATSTTPPAASVDRNSRSGAKRSTNVDGGTRFVVAVPARVGVSAEMPPEHRSERVLAAPEHPSAR